MRQLVNKVAKKAFKRLKKELDRNIQKVDKVTYD